MRYSIYRAFRDSLGEAKSASAIATGGILAALSVALKFMASIDIGQFIRIGISDFPAMAASALFGPSLGGLFWAALDIIKYFAAPSGPYFFGFTISAAISGMIFGLFLYKRPLSIYRVFMATALNKVIVSLIMNTYWLTVLYGSAFFAILPARILTNAIMLPIDTALTFALLKLAKRMYALHRLPGRRV